MRRDDGYAGGDAKTNVTKPSQFVHGGINLLRGSALRIEDGFCIVEDYNHLLRG